MSNSYNVAWEKESDLRLVKGQALYFGGTIDSQIKNNQKVQAELESDRAVFFRLQDGRFSAEDVHGNELGSSSATVFKDYPNALAHGVRDQRGEVTLNLDVASREQLRERQIRQERTLGR